MLSECAASHQRQRHPSEACVQAQLPGELLALLRPTPIPSPPPCPPVSTPPSSTPTPFPPHIPTASTACLPMCRLRVAWGASLTSETTASRLRKSQDRRRANRASSTCLRRCPRDREVRRWPAGRRLCRLTEGWWRTGSFLCFLCSWEEEESETALPLTNLEHKTDFPRKSCLHICQPTRHARDTGHVIRITCHLMEMRWMVTNKSEVAQSMDFHT